MKAKFDVEVRHSEHKAGYEYRVSLHAPDYYQLGYLSYPRASTDGAEVIKQMKRDLANTLFSQLFDGEELFEDEKSSGESPGSD